MVYVGMNCEHVNCDFCGNNKTESLLLGRDLYNNVPGEFNVVRCRSCGMVFTNPRPSAAEMSKYYPDEAGYFHPPADNARQAKFASIRRKFFNKVLSAYFGYTHLANVNLVEKLLFLPLYGIHQRQWAMEGIPIYRGNRRLLEAGCSYGAYLNKMKSLGWDVAGIEPNKKAADYGNAEFGLNIIKGTFDDIMPDGKFDVIVFRMVMEHLPSPSQAFAKACGLLADDGQIIIIVPDFSGIEFRMFKEYCYGLQVPTHLYHFTPASIRRYCTKYGFKVDRIIHHDFDRDFVASARYMKDAGLHGWLFQLLANKLVRNTALKALVTLLSYLGMTSRMTVWISKDARSTV